MLKPIFHPLYEPTTIFTTINFLQNKEVLRCGYRDQTWTFPPNIEGEEPGLVMLEYSTVLRDSAFFSTSFPLRIIPLMKEGFLLDSSLLIYQIQDINPRSRWFLDRSPILQAHQWQHQATWIHRMSQDSMALKMLKTPPFQQFNIWNIRCRGRSPYYARWCNHRRSNVPQIHKEVPRKERRNMVQVCQWGMRARCWQWGYPTCDWLRQGL